MKEKSLLAERINHLCKEKEMTYDALSYKSAIPMTTLMHIVKEQATNPGILIIGKICDGFGISLKEFFDLPESESIEWLKE